jgi:hypothetical protein
VVPDAETNDNDRMTIRCSHVGRYTVHVCFIVAVTAAWSADLLRGADRTTLLIPCPVATSPLPADAVYPDAAFADQEIAGWSQYMRLWRAHHDQPGDPAIRRYLGLPLTADSDVRQQRGRSAPRWLGWNTGSYQQYDTPHFVLYSRGDQATSHRVAADLEQCYWVWTQMFFPMWEGRRQVAATIGQLPADQSVSDFLAAHRTDRLTTRRKLRVVLFRNLQEYRQTITVPGAERSTGFYNDSRKTMFLYAGDSDDVATRRHELVHQLFREATDSGLGDQLPGEHSEFWLIEGIAGYFESLFIAEDHATVGGWDSPRLQFARYRAFVMGDRMPFDELQRDGRLAAQQRPDIPRWYAHAITRTHHLIDGGHADGRRWIYQRLAEQYKLDPAIAAEAAPPTDEEAVLSFLSIDDDHLAANVPARPLSELCLAGCQITPRGLLHVRPSPQLNHLTLIGPTLDVAAIERLICNPESIRQLNLERTGIDASIANLLRACVQLSELDLSNTGVGDAAVQALDSAPRLTTLWLTGTKVSDAAITSIAGLPKLGDVDLQRTEVTAEGLDRLRRLRPELTINPLQIQGVEP